MKTLSKLIAIAITAISLFLTTNVKAQTTPANALRFGIGIDAGDPTSNLRLSSTFVLGGTASLQYGLSNSFAITLTSGADHFFSKYIPGTTKRYDSFGIIPIQAGFKEFYTPNLYIAVESGVAIEETDSGTGKKKLILAPAVGYANEHWDVGVRYESLTGDNDNYGFVALRIAYGFKL